MDAYSTLAKVGYARYDEIQSWIDAGKIDENDIIFTTDTHQTILIANDYQIVPINGKVYVFETVKEAEEILNQSPDTYEGQVVSIRNLDKYAGYIVYKSPRNSFKVSPINTYSGEIDYDNLGNKPIIQMTGTIENPVILSSLPNGTYKIDGQYLYTADDGTIYLSAVSNVFLIESGDESIHVKKISATEIADFNINVVTGETTQNNLASIDFIVGQGYATERYVDKRLAALDYITKEEIDKYVTQVVETAIANMVEPIIDKKIDERFKPADFDQIIGLF